MPAAERKKAAAILIAPPFITPEIDEIAARSTRHGTTRTGHQSFALSPLASKLTSAAYRLGLLARALL
jgi:hypothetical protein